MNIRTASVVIAALFSATACGPNNPYQCGVLGCLPDTTVEKGEVIQHNGSEQDMDDLEGIEPTVNECETDVYTADGEWASLANTVILEQIQGADQGSQPTDKVLHPIACAFELEDDECATVTLTGFQYVVVWSDRADTGWQPEEIVPVLSTNQWYEYDIVDRGGIIEVNVYSAIEMMPGNMELVSLMLTANGANADLDDFVQVGINNVTIDDGAGDVMLHDLDISCSGAPIVF